MKKNGFTLVEVIAVVAILAILTVIVVPRISSTIDNNKKKACNSIKVTAEDAANTYTYKYTSVINSGITTNGYADITLLKLKQEGLIQTKLINPYTNEEISNTNVVRVTKDGNAYQFTYMGDDCN